MKTSELGQLGEDLATRYLRRNGYKVIDRNHRTKWGELDIIAVSPERMLVFIEVKTVSGPSPQFTPEQQVTSAKLAKFRRATELYANGVGKHLVGEKGYRMDLVAITVEGEEAAIKHYKNL